MNTEKTESAQKVDFPTVHVGEVTVFDVRSPLGLFGYRISHQAVRLLDWPAPYDLGKVSEEERRFINDGFLQLRHPITALGLFLGVVALEDFVRDLLHRLREDDFVGSHFPKLQNLEFKDIESKFKHICPKEWNKLFSIIDLKPIPTVELPHIRDLVYLRNAIAHYGSLTPEKYRNKFEYWDVKIGQPINPPASFVRAELNYIFHLGLRIHEETRRIVFRRVIEKMGCGWSKNPSSDILRLIGLFCFFGFLEQARGPVVWPSKDPNFRDLLGQDFLDSLEQAEANNQDLLSRLQSRCIDGLVAEFGD